LLFTYIKNYYNIMTHNYLFTQTFNKKAVTCPAFHPELTPPPNNTGNCEIKISQFTRDFFRHHNKPVWFN
jgi:hypothetical protein